MERMRGILEKRIWSHDEILEAAEQEEQVRTLGAELGVDRLSVEGWAPLVVRGAVDGRGFYLRERHDVWRVEIAPDENPGIDPWTAGREISTIRVASGVSDVLEEDGVVSRDRAVRVAVGAVRRFLRQRSCVHQAPQGARYCPACGVELETA